MPKQALSKLRNVEKSNDIKASEICEVITMGKVVLLDVDGVILRHPPTLNKIGKRIDSLVAKTVGVSEEHGAKINQRLYKTFGHTYIGLRKMYPRIMSLDDFNQSIYTEDALMSIQRCTYNVDVLESIIVMQRFLQTCNNAGVPVYMFSNAPRVWCEEIYNSFHIHRWIPSDHILSCDHEIFQGHLKPQPIVYDTLQQYLRFQYKNDHLRMIFVDDTFANLVPIMDKPYWKPVLFDTNVPMVSPKIYHATSFEHLHV